MRSYPYTINERNLARKVRALKDKNRLPGAVWTRCYRQGENRFQIKQELANSLIHEFVSITEILENEEFSEGLKDWAVRLEKGRMEFFYNRFAKYLRMGTIITLKTEHKYE